jgi:beta-galactosidase
LSVPAGVEVTRREADDAAYLFLLNHTDDPVGIELPDGVDVELLTQETPGSALRLAPLGVAVVRVV